MNTPSEDVRRTEVVVPARLPDGLDALAHRGQGRWRRRRAVAESLRAEAEQVWAAAEAMRDMHANDLRVLLAEHARRARRLGKRWVGEFAAMLPALVEAADRQLGRGPIPCRSWAPSAWRADC